MKKEIYAVVGPTASGKSNFAIMLAKKIGGEIISADSMQIYKEMNIGTAKISKKEMQNIAHHMIDIISVTENFSVAQFVNMAKKIILDIYDRGKIPIICGGTGLYVDSVLKNFSFSEQDVDQKLRDSLLDRMNKFGTEELWKELFELDPDYAKYIHPNNIKRVIRALEFCTLSGRTMTEQKKLTEQLDQRYDTTIYGLTYASRETLYDRINQRVDLMMERGLLQEAKSIYEMDLSSTAKVAIGYKELFEYFEGKCTLDDAVDNIKNLSRKYAKRQLTWFRRNKNIIWIYRDKDELL